MVEFDFTQHTNLNLKGFGAIFCHDLHFAAMSSRRLFLVSFVYSWRATRLISADRFLGGGCADLSKLEV